MEFRLQRDTVTNLNFLTSSKWFVRKLIPGELPKGVCYLKEAVK